MSQYTFAEASTIIEEADLPPGEATEILDTAQPTARGLGWLVIVAGPNKNGLYPLAEGETLVGRAFDCQIELVDKSVSRHHATLHSIISPQIGYCFVITDLQSANGTLVNGQPITSQLLEDEDYIQIGRFDLVFKQLLLKNKPS